MIQALINRLLRFETIDGAGATDQYLRRWWLLSLPGKRRVYLHHFVGSDWARDMHDHPKWFVSIGLWGGYVEETYGPSRPYLDWARRRVKRRRWTAPWIRFFPATHVHRLRINRARPCWTIIITGPEQREWGFWTPAGWIEWSVYVAHKGGAKWLGEEVR